MGTGSGGEAGRGLMEKAARASCGAIGEETWARQWRGCIPDAANAEVLPSVTAVRILRDRRYGETVDVRAGVLSVNESVVFCQQMMGEMNDLFRF